MSQNANRASSVKNGFQVGSGPSFHSGNGNPSGNITNAKKGSFYLNESNGAAYTLTSIDPDVWTQRILISAAQKTD